MRGLVALAGAVALAAGLASRNAKNRKGLVGDDAGPDGSAGQASFDRVAGGDTGGDDK